MLAFIESIIRLLVKLIFVDEIAQENEELKKEVQQLKQEKEESKQEKEKIAEGKQQLEERNQQLIQQNFNLVRKYIAVNQQKEQLIQKLDEYKSAQSAQAFNHYCSAVGLNYSKSPTTKPNKLDINQESDSDDLDVIDQLVRDFNSSEELTI